MTAFDGPNHLTEVVDFDYDALDHDQEAKNESVDDEFWRIQGEILAEILRWLTAPGKATAVGQRTLALALYLRPSLIEHDSLEKIAKSCANGVGRAALSHSLRMFQEQFGAHRGYFQKAAYLSEVYSRSATLAHQERKLKNSNGSVAS